MKFQGYMISETGLMQFPVLLIFNAVFFITIHASEFLLTEQYIPLCGTLG
jgi:hypothetical protein